MTNEEVLKKIIEEKYQNVKAFSEKINIPYTTVRSILERGLLNAKIFIRLTGFNWVKNYLLYSDLSFARF